MKGDPTADHQDIPKLYRRARSKVLHVYFTRSRTQLSTNNTCLCCFLGLGHSIQFKIGIPGKIKPTSPNCILKNVGYTL